MLENFLADLKASLTASPIVEDIEILDEFITSVSGFLDCKAMMIDGSVQVLIIRWDNAPHHREISSFPFHMHKKDGVYESKEMNTPAGREKP